MLRKIFFIVPLIFLSSSCAFVDKEISLEPNSPQYNNAKANETVYLNEFKDKRNIKDKIGVIKNGYGMETANVTTDQDISALIEESLIRNLKNAGFNIKKLVATSNINALLSNKQMYLEGAIYKFYVEPNVGWWYADMVADINIKINVKSKNETFSESYRIESKNPDMYWGASSSYEDPLETSIEKLTSRITTDLIYFANKL